MRCQPRQFATPPRPTTRLAPKTGDCLSHVQDALYHYGAVHHQKGSAVVLADLESEGGKDPDHRRDRRWGLSRCPAPMGRDDPEPERIDEPAVCTQPVMRTLKTSRRRSSRAPAVRSAGRKASMTAPATLAPDMMVRWASNAVLAINRLKTAFEYELKLTIPLELDPRCVLEQIYYGGGQFRLCSVEGEPDAFAHRQEVHSL